LTDVRQDVEIDGALWSFHCLDAGPGHIATLATNIPDATVTVRWWRDTTAARLAQWSKAFDLVLDE
jgi:uncharacterized membrane protein YhaH (DUF805 family)